MSTATTGAGATFSASMAAAYDPSAARPRRGGGAGAPQPAPAVVPLAAHHHGPATVGAAGQGGSRPGHGQAGPFHQERNGYPPGLGGLVQGAGLRGGQDREHALMPPRPRRTPPRPSARGRKTPARPPPRDGRLASRQRRSERAAARRTAPARR